MCFLKMQECNFIKVKKQVCYIDVYFVLSFCPPAPTQSLLGAPMHPCYVTDYGTLHTCLSWLCRHSNEEGDIMCKGSKRATVLMCSTFFREAFMCNTKLWTLRVSFLIVGDFLECKSAKLSWFSNKV